MEACNTTAALHASHRLINGLEKDSLLYHVAGGARNASKYGRMVFKCQQANCDRSGLGKCARLAGVSGG